MIKDKILAIIPARSGSKGLPDKNIRDLLGKPLIAYSIKAAKESEIFDKIIVSTDSQKYAEIACKYGAEVPWLRSNYLSTDKSSTVDVILDCIELLLEKHLKYDMVCVLQPTSPLRTWKNIAEAYELFKKNNANSVVSVCECEHSPLWMNTLEQNLKMDNFIREDIKNIARQELKQYYRLNGAIYLTRIDFLQRNHAFIGKDTYAYIMQKKESVDIDTFEDFDYAEYTLRRKEVYHEIL